MQGSWRGEVGVLERGLAGDLSADGFSGDGVLGDGVPGGAGPAFGYVFAVPAGWVPAVDAPRAVGLVGGFGGPWSVPGWDVPPWDLEGLDPAGGPAGGAPGGGWDSGGSAPAPEGAAGVCALLPGLGPRALVAVLDAAVTALGGWDPADVPDAVAGEVVLALVRAERRQAAVAAGWVRRFDAAGACTGDGAVSTAAWLRARLGCTPAQARARVVLARALPDLPAMAAELAGGRVGPEHLAPVVRAYTKTPARRDSVGELDPLLVAVAAGHGAGGVAAAVARWAAAVDAGGGGAEPDPCDRAWLHASATLDGMVRVDGLLDPETGARLLAALDRAGDRLFRTRPGADPGAVAGPRGLDPSAGPRSARNAAALALLLDAVEAAGDLAAVPPARALLLVQTPLDVLAAHRGTPGRAPAAPAASHRANGTGPGDGTRISTGKAGTGKAGTGKAAGAAPGRRRRGRAPGPGAGGPGAGTGGAPQRPGGRFAALLDPASGPHLLSPFMPRARLTGAAARRLACDSRLARLVLDPSGAVLDLGHGRGTITGAQRLAVTARDVVCRFPGCHRPSRHVHHITWRSHGGRHRLDNLAAVCHAHHRALHEGGFGCTGLAQGPGLTFTRPDGTTLHQEQGARQAAAAAKRTAPARR